MRETRGTQGIGLAVLACVVALWAGVSLAQSYNVTVGPEASPSTEDAKKTDAKQEIFVSDAQNTTAILISPSKGERLDSIPLVLSKDTPILSEEELQQQ